jgi:sec-independent protein translocase protein TatA
VNALHERSPFYILFIFLLVFGAGKLPELGSGIGKAIRNFRSGVSEKDNTNKSVDDQEKNREINNE